MSEETKKGADVVPLPTKRKVRPCSTCGKPSVQEYRPFCSKRCADIDLGRWLKEDYRVPVEDEPDQYEEDM